MPNTIIVKRSSVAGKVPLSTDLQVGELAVNLADQKIYSKNASGTVVQLGGGTASGDVVGPTSSTDNALVRFDGTTGKLVQNSAATLDDVGNMDTASVKGDFFDLDTAATAPANAVGREAWDDGSGTAILGLKGGNVIYYYGQQEFARVFNGSGAAMTKGQVVYIVGAQGNRIDVRLARANVESTSANTIGFVAESIAAGAEGWVQTAGPLPQLNTSTLTAGQVLYLSPTTAGAYTTTKPAAPNQLVVLGFVERVHATAGSIYVKVNNGYELDELHDVLITSPTSGNTLIYDAATAVWKNANITAGSGVSVTNGAGSITIANTAPDQTVALTGAGATTVTGTYPNFTISSVNTTYSLATSTVLGLIKLGSNTQQTVAPNAVTATASRSYALQVNADGQGVINVPWTNSGGTVTSVGGTGTVSGISLSGTVTSSGNLTLGGTLSVTPSNFASQSANTVLAAPNGASGVPTFRAIVAEDIPTLNQNTTGTSASSYETFSLRLGGGVNSVGTNEPPVGSLTTAHALVVVDATLRSATFVPVVKQITSTDGSVTITETAPGVFDLSAGTPPPAGFDWFTSDPSPVDGTISLPTNFTASPSGFANVVVAGYTNGSWGPSGPWNPSSPGGWFGNVNFVPSFDWMFVPTPSYSYASGVSQGVAFNYVQYPAGHSVVNTSNYWGSSSSWNSGFGSFFNPGSYPAFGSDRKLFGVLVISSGGTDLTSLVSTNPSFPGTTFTAYYDIYSGVTVIAFQNLVDSEVATIVGSGTVAIAWGGSPYSYYGHSWTEYN